MKHNLFSRFISVLLAVVMLAGLMSMPSLADAVTGTDTATADVQTTDSVDTTTDEAGSAPATLSEDGEKDEATAGEESGEHVTEEDTASENEAASSEAVSSSSVEADTSAAVQLEAAATDANGTVVANVTVEADEGVIPEGATLVAELLTGDDAEAAGQELEEAGVEYDGYMALDIHLEDADGSEVEPKGEVRVVMLAPAALPEDADPTTVAVQHHEEQDNGEVKVEEVASAAETAATPATLSLTEDSTEQPATGVATEDTDVTAAFTVDKFSSFTIVWNYGRNITVKYVQYIDGEYKENFDVANAPDNVSVSANNIESLDEYKQYAVDSGYTVVDVKREHDWSWNGWQYVDHITEIQYNRNERSLQYKTENSNSWQDFNNWGDNLLIVCEVNPLGTVNTVDSQSKGVNITLFDYDQGTVNNATSSKFKFVNGYYGEGDWNTWVGGRGVIQGILQNKLNDKGFPVFSNMTGIKENGQLKDLEYLFSTDENVSKASKIVQNVNHLFLQSTYDSTGYFEYDASQNFASIQNAPDEDGNYSFKVYDTAYKPNDDEASVPKFLPFNDLAVGDANNLLEGSSIDYHFGMMVDFNFIQPKDGQVEYNDKTNDMVFEFTGDDDVWLFIDGVLVMDMGGIHDAQTSTVNFATGEVTIKQVYKPNSASNANPAGTNEDKTFTLYNLMLDAKGHDWVEANMEENADGHWVFKDYTSHSFKYFYLERGAGGSNCRIKFNLQTVPAGTLDIAKNVTFTNTADASDIEFEYNAYINTDPDKNENFTLYEGAYSVYELDGDELVYENLTATNGIIKIKDGQYARLHDEDLIKANSKYYIVEIGATSDKYTVKIDETTLSYVDSDGIVVSGDQDKTEYGVMSGKYAVNERSRVIFNNIVKTENQYALNITKVLATDQVAADDTYEMQVTIGGQLYNGKYKVGNTEYTAEKGIIRLKAGQTAVILNLMGGNSIRVEEVGLNNSNYGTPVYEISGPIKENTDVTDGYAGAIAEEGNALGDTPKVNVTVTNSRLKSNIVITKQIVNEAYLTEQEINAIKNSLSFKVTGANSYSKTISAGDITWDGNTGTASIYNVDPDKYTVTESVGGIQATDAVLEATVSVNGATSQSLTSEGASGTVDAGKQLTFAITNTYKPATGTLKIVKELASGSTADDSGKSVFSFKIQKLEDNVPTGTVWYMHVNRAGDATLDGDTSKTTLELPAGTYQVTELKNINFTCTDIAVTGTSNPIINKDTGSATVEIGGNNVTVTYTNSSKGTNFTDGSGVINKFSDASGIITFDRIAIAGDTEEIKNWSSNESTGEQRN